jgi:hypothetical protein
MSLISKRIGHLSAGLLALAVVHPTPAQAADRFVNATTGHDNGAANDCLNAADRCKTITHAIDEADPDGGMRGARRPVVVSRRGGHCEPQAKQSVVRTPRAPGLPRSRWSLALTRIPQGGGLPGRSQ